MDVLVLILFFGLFYVLDYVFDRLGRRLLNYPLFVEAWLMTLEIMS